MSARASWRPILAAVLALACAEVPDAEELRVPIIGGTPDDGDPAIIGLLERDGSLVCTGTLIAPRAILTAAHCRFLVDARLAHFGPDVTAPAPRVALSLALTPDTFDPVSLQDDVAVFLLDEAAPAAAGAPLGLATAPPAVGEEVRFVGFGHTIIPRDGTYGVKTTLAVPVTQVDAQTFRYGVATCNGDSGGPALAAQGGDEVVVGITSWGDARCAEYGVDTRVDAYATFIAEAVATPAPRCGADGACGDACPDVDPDCPCLEDGLCTAACTDAAMDPDCPPECAADGTCRDACPVPDPDCVPADGGGCGCRVGGVPPARSAGLLALVLVALALARGVGSRRA